MNVTLKSSRSINMSRLPMVFTEYKKNMWYLDCIISLRKQFFLPIPNEQSKEMTQLYKLSTVIGTNRPSKERERERKRKRKRKRERQEAVKKRTNGWNFKPLLLELFQRITVLLGLHTVPFHSSSSIKLYAPLSFSPSPFLLMMSQVEWSK